MSNHQPRAGRMAYICGHKDHEKDSAPRRFIRPGEPIPQCKRHGRMQRQENAPYLGQPIPEVAHG